MKAKTKKDLTPVNIDTLNSIFQCCILMQTALHRLESVSDSVIFVRQNKQELNRTIKFLSQNVEELTMQLDCKESQEYIDIVNEVEKVINQIKLTV
jgi:hypothetical protein